MIRHILYYSFLCIKLNTSPFLSSADGKSIMDELKINKKSNNIFYCLAYYTVKLAGRGSNPTQSNKKIFISLLILSLFIFLNGIV